MVFYPAPQNTRRGARRFAPYLGFHFCRKPAHIHKIEIYIAGFGFDAGRGRRRKRFGNSTSAISGIEAEHTPDGASLENKREGMGAAVSPR